MEIALKKLFKRIPYVKSLYSKFVINLKSDRKFYEDRYKEVFGRELNLECPQRLTEKIQWLKLYDRRDFFSQCADKYAVRDYLKSKFGDECEQYLIPLLYQTEKWSDITLSIIPNEPCIVKANHDSGHFSIIRDKSKVDIVELRNNCKKWLQSDYYKLSREWQYKNIKPRRIIIEKLLQTKSGKIPNDYKLHYINGDLQFVYVSYDREGINDRCVYDRNWERCPFIWVPKETYRTTMNTAEVPKPSSFDKMIEFGDAIAKDFAYVRVDFYDVDGQLYFGEITLHHGSGFDTFFPDSYDMYFGNKCDLPI